MRLLDSLAAQLPVHANDPTAPVAVLEHTPFLLTGAVPADYLAAGPEGAWDEALQLLVDEATGAPLFDTDPAAATSTRTAWPAPNIGDDDSDV